MDREVRAAIAEAFARRGVTDLWLMYDEDYPSEAVFVVRDADYPHIDGNAALFREVAALLPYTKLGVIPYTGNAPGRRLLPPSAGDTPS